MFGYIYLPAIHVPRAAPANVTTLLGVRTNTSSTSLHAGKSADEGLHVTWRRGLDASAASATGLWWLHSAALHRPPFVETTALGSQGQAAASLQYMAKSITGHGPGGFMQACQVQLTLA